MSFLGGLAGGAIGGAVVNLYLDDKQFKTGLAGAEAQTKGATTTASKFGTIAKAGLAAAGVAAVKFAGDAVAAYNESAKVMAQTEATIRSTGGAAGFTSEQIGAMASQFQDLTTYTDEQVQSAENMLLTFTNIGHDVFPTATQTILDMSTALDKDLQSSAIQVGKALNDPVGGITALSRAGVQFTEDQKKVIEKMVETGDVAGAQQVILAELSKEFGGSAAAAAGTFEGKMAQLKNTFGDVQEVIGGLIVNSLTWMLDNIPTVTSYVVAFGLAWAAVNWSAIVAGAKAAQVSLAGLAGKLSAVAGGLAVVAAGAYALGSVSTVPIDKIEDLNDQLDTLAAASEGGTIDAIGGLKTQVDFLTKAFDADSKAVKYAILHHVDYQTALDATTKDTKEADKAIEKLANNKAEMAAFRESTKTAFNIAGESVFGFKRKVEGTARSFQRGLENMRQQAQETFRDLREFNKIDLGAGVKKFLLEQGPAAIDAFMDSNRKGRVRIVDDIAAINEAHKRQGVEIDQATGKTNNLNDAMDKLGRKKVTAEARIKYMLAEDSLDPGSLPGLSGNG